MQTQDVKVAEKTEVTLSSSILNYSEPMIINWLILLFFFAEDAVQGVCDDHHRLDLVRPHLHTSLARMEGRGRGQRLVRRWTFGERKSDQR